MESIKLNIVELIEQNPITTLSKTYQGKLLTKIQDSFTEFQQRLFISSFYTYLNYNSKIDFIIELESIWKWLGFSRKDPAKVVLIKHFKENIDYKIITIKDNEEKDTINLSEETISQQPLENKNNTETRGRKKEKIVMTINTFKKLCLKSDTKKADEIHDYYIKLEEMIQETIKEQSEELREEIINKNTLLIEKDLVIESTNKLLTELENKPNTEGFNRKNGYIYLVKDITKKGHFKIGYADNTTTRLGNLNCSSSTCSLELVMEFKTFDKEFIEKIIHSALNPFKIKTRKEWFYIRTSIELLYVINTIKKCIEFGKQFDIKDYNHFKLLNKDIDAINELNILQIQYEFISLPKPVHIGKTDIERCPEENLLDTSQLKVYTPKKLDDYKTFLNECCDFNDEYIISFLELKEQYKIWSHNSEFDKWESMIKEITKEYPIKKFKIEHMARSKKKCFIGFKLKDQMYNFDLNFHQSVNKIENFLYDSCKKSPLLKISHNDLYLSFEKYNKQKDEKYIFTTVEKELLDNYFDCNFLRSKVGSVINKKDGRIYGWAGIGLKENKKEISYKIITKTTNKNAKKVLQKDSDGNILNEFYSLTTAASYLKLHSATLSNHIKSKKMIKDDSKNLETYFTYSLTIPNNIN